MDSVRRDICTESLRLPGKKSWGSRKAPIYIKARESGKLRTPVIQRSRDGGGGGTPLAMRCISLCLFVKRQKKQKVPEEMILQTL